MCGGAFHLLIIIVSARHPPGNDGMNTRPFELRPTVNEYWPVFNNDTLNNNLQVFDNSVDCNQLILKASIFS